MAELNRQEKKKEMNKFNERLKQYQEDTDRLRLMKIEVHDKRRHEAIARVRKKEAEIELKAYKEGYEVRVKEILNKREVRVEDINGIYE